MEDDGALVIGIANPEAIPSDTQLLPQL